MIAKEVLKLQNLHMLIKQKSRSLSRNLALRTFGELLTVLNKDKSAIRPLFNCLELLPSEFDKAKLFTKNFFLNYNLDNSGISLTVFSSRTNVTLHTISVNYQDG